MNWIDCMKDKIFITVLSAEGNEASPGRYAVWAPDENSHNHRIVEVSESLDYLIEKYKITQDRIIRSEHY